MNPEKKERLDVDMVSSHVTPHEIMEIKHFLNNIADRMDNVEKELYRIGPNAK